MRFLNLDLSLTSLVGASLISSCFASGAEFISESDGMAKFAISKSDFRSNFDRDTKSSPRRLNYSSAIEDARTKVQPRSEDTAHVMYLNHPWEKTRRNLQTAESTAYQPLRIKFYTGQIEQYRGSSLENNARIDFIINEVLPEMAHEWSSALSVVPVAGRLKIDPLTLFGDRKCYWSTVPDSHIQDGVFGADLIIYVSANPEEDYCGSGELATAISCNMDQYDRPTAGAINFCLETIRLQDDLTASEETRRDLVGVATHEVGHVLGMDTYLMLFFRDAKTGDPLTPRPHALSKVTCVSGEEREVLKPADNTLALVQTATGTRYAEIRTPTVRQVVRNQFDCQVMTGARFENQPPNEKSCFGSHWDERLFYTEAMGPVINSVTNVLSPLTLALLEDSGWYKADYSVAGISVFGHGAGCDFVYEDCIVEGEVPSYSKGFFCNDLLTISMGKQNIFLEGVFGCDASSTHKSLCDMVDYDDPILESIGFDTTPPPEENQYFKPNNYGAFTKWTDYCPVHFDVLAVDCTDPNNTSKNSNEVFSSESRCMETNTETSLCLVSRCNEDEHLVEVDVGEETFRCLFDGQLHTMPDTTTQFKCPRIATICPNLICHHNCAGRGICDFSQRNPECVCFDASDATNDCTATEIRAESDFQPKVEENAGYSAPEALGMIASTVSRSTVAFGVACALLLGLV